MQPRRQHRHGIGSAKRDVFGQHLEDDGAEAVDVRTRVDVTTGQLLRRCVGDGAEKLVRPGQPCFVGLAQVGKAEVDDLVDPLPGRELVRDDVRRLQIAVHDSQIVGELQRRTERRHDLLHLRDRHPAVCGELLFQGLPVEQFHDQERVILVVHVEVENRDDVGMAETGAGAAFAEESIARSGAAGLRSHDLDRDFVPEQRAPRAIDGAHSSFGQQREDFVTVVEDLAGGEHSGIICFRLGGSLLAVGCWLLAVWRIEQPRAASREQLSSNRHP